jgi:hypothetical protein
MKVAAPLVLACFTIAFTLSATGWFERFSSSQLFGMETFLSSGGFAVLCRLSEKFRLFLRRCSLKRLTLAQTLRFYGVLALIKAHQQVLPAAFAIPTGLIDMAFAITSFFVAARLVNSQGKDQPGLCRLARGRAGRSGDFRNTRGAHLLRALRTGGHEPYEPAHDVVSDEPGARFHRADDFDFPLTRPRWHLRPPDGRAFRHLRETLGLPAPAETYELGLRSALLCLLHLWSREDFALGVAGTSG